MNANPQYGVLVYSQLAARPAPGSHAYDYSPAALWASALLVAVLFAAAVLVLILRAVSRNPVQQPQQIHLPTLHASHIQCAKCGLTVARYNEEGICANCQSES